jgi:hypothetical protein
MLGFPRMKPARRDLLFAAALFLASSGTVQQYLGLAGVAAYALGLLVAVPVALQIALPWFERHVSERRAVILAGATFVVLVVVFAVVYPHANVHTPGHGSDRDDAANIGTHRLFHLEYPYSQPTYLGNMISQLPGAFILDGVFVAVGSSAYQNVFWIAVLFLLLRWWARDGRVALAALWLALALSPALLREYLNGGDVIANTVAMIAFMLGVLDLPTRWARVGAAVGLGLALAWRPNLWYWLPLFLVAVAYSRGWRAALGYVAVAVGVCAAVTLPFYVTHRHDFAPLLTARKVRRYDDVVPSSSVFVLGATAVLALGLCRQLLRGKMSVLAACALVQAFLLGLVVLLASISAAKPDFSPLVLAYGLFFLVPAMFWLARSRTPETP